MAPNQEVLQPAAADVQDGGDSGTVHNQNENAAISFSDVFDNETTDKLAKKHDMIWKPMEVTDEDRKDAKEDLADELSELIPEEDRKNLLKAQAAIIDGDTKALSEALAAYKDNPEMLAKIVKELDKNLTRDHAGVHLALNKAGNVVMYGRGDTALEISPKDGSVTVRSIEHNKDGSITVNPGEVVGTDAAKVAKGIGDEATRNIVHPFIHFPKMGGSLGVEGARVTMGTPAQWAQERYGDKNKEGGGGGAGGGEVIRPPAMNGPR